MGISVKLLALTIIWSLVQANPSNIPIIGPISLWRLPQDGSAMYYRYFRDRISWYEADAVCQFHHGNLVTVDTSNKYDALRSFLRHENIVSNVWIGLVRSHKDSAFTWAGTYRSLTGDGYWAESLPSTSAPLCATSDPARDYRWHARHCGGAEVAAFVCELRVPDWTKECTITTMTGIQYAYLPEEVAVQLEVKCPLDEGGLRKVRCRGRQDRKSVEKLLACTPTPGDISENMIAQSSGLGKAQPSTQSSPAGTRTWRYTSVSTIEDGPQTRHRREAEIATAPDTEPTWSSSSTFKTTSIDEEIDALEETARKDGVLVEDSDVDLMMADERTIENFVVDSTPTSEATDVEVDVIETVNTFRDSVTPNVVSSELPTQEIVASEVSAVTQRNSITTTLKSDLHGIKPPMVHARSDVKTVEWTSVGPDDDSVDMRLLGHLPKSKAVLETKKDLTTSVFENESQSTVDAVTTDESEPSTPVLQKMLPVDGNVVLLKESSYSIIKNGTVIDVLELNDTLPDEEKLTTERTVNAAIIEAKPIEDNMVLREEELAVKPNQEIEDKTKMSEHQIVEVTFTEPSVFSSTLVITTKPFKKSINVDANKPAQEIDPRIQLLNANLSKVNVDSEILYENKSNIDLTKGSSTSVPNGEKTVGKKMESSTADVTSSGDQDVDGTGFQEAEIEPSEEIEPEPEPMHRPNRRRLLTKPEPRGGYPFYIRRVLG